MLEMKNNDLMLEYNQAQADAKKAIAYAKDLENDRDKLKKQVDQLRKELEVESLARVDVMNSNQNLRYELSSKDQIYQQQFKKIRMCHQIELSKIDGRLAEQYKAKLQQALQELRVEYETQMDSNRQRIELLYQSRIKNYQTAASRHSSTTWTALEEVRQARLKIDNYRTRIGDLENQNSERLSKVRDLEKQIENERLKHAEGMAWLERELSLLRNEIAQQLQDYQHLMDIKVSLNLEIAAYKKLLEDNKEACSNTTTRTSMELQQAACSSSQRRTSVRSGAKRKCTLLDESQEATMNDYTINKSSKGDIVIAEADPEGKFVKIFNKGSKELALGGWQVVRKAGDQEVVYKFHYTVKIKPNLHITIWSSNSGHKNEPPSNLVMKGQIWFVAGNMTTSIINKNGEEIAVSQRTRRQLSSSQLRLSGYLDSEEWYHQKGKYQSEEKCKIM